MAEYDDIFGVKPQNRFKKKMATLRQPSAPLPTPTTAPRVEFPITEVPLETGPAVPKVLRKEEFSSLPLPEALNLSIPASAPNLRKFKSLKQLLQPQEEMPNERKSPEYYSQDAFKLAKSLVAFAESNYGANTRHPTIVSGEQKGSRAVGQYGITPIVVQDMLQRFKSTPAAKVLLEKGYSGLSPEEISDKLEKDPQTQELIVDQLLQRLLKNQQGDPVRAAIQYMGNPDAPYQKDFSKAHPDIKKREQRILRHYNELLKSNK